MKTPRIYLDTSVLGGCFDPEFSEWSNGLMEDFRAGRFIPVLSDWLGTEISRAPQRVQDVHTQLLGMPERQMITISTDALNRLAAYEAHSVLGPRYRGDMFHFTSRLPPLQKWTCW